MTRVLGFVREFTRHQSGLHSDGLKDLRELCNESSFGPRGPEADAGGCSVHRMSLAASVANESPAAVGNAEHSSAAPTSKHSRQERLPASARLGGSCRLTEGVALKLVSDLLEVFTGNVPLVMIPDQHGPVTHRS